MGVIWSSIPPSLPQPTTPAIKAVIVKMTRKILAIDV
jgi:hypothetical protein